MQTEIILLIILAASMILVISNFGLGGAVGDQISAVCFGIMGLLAYVFPVLLFVGAAFLMSNRKNPLAYKKTLAALVFFLFLCIFRVRDLWIIINAVQSFIREAV